MGRIGLKKKILNHINESQIKCKFLGSGLYHYDTEKYLIKLLVGQKTKPDSVEIINKSTKEILLELGKKDVYDIYKKVKTRYYYLQDKSIS